MSSAVGAERALFVDPASHHFFDDRLFDAGSVRTHGGDLHAPYIHLKESMEALEIPVHTADHLFRGSSRADWYMYMSFGIRRRRQSWPGWDRSSSAPSSPSSGPSSSPVSTETCPGWLVPSAGFSFSDAESPRPFVGSDVVVHRFRIPQARATVHRDLWGRQQRGFLAMINANKLPRLFVNELYTERLRAVAHSERCLEIDLYGVGWDLPPYRMAQTRTPAVARRAIRWVQARCERVRPDPLLLAARRGWRGVAASKAEVLSRYRFTICFENIRLRGWITEKVFDCMYAGTVPVYLGAPEFADVVPRECFIDMRRFADYDALGEYLPGLSDVEVSQYREAARKYLSSTAYRALRKEEFARLIAGIVAEDTGAEVELAWA